jgi:hypothetical protein
VAGQAAAIDLRIELLGRFSVSAAGRSVDEAAWRLRKARSVVKLLALAAEHRLHREHLMDALWPDREAAAAANNLRQAVFVARRALDSCGVDGAARLVLHGDVLAAYVNFMGDEGDARVRATYEPATFARLRELKAQLDPTNFFHLNQNVPPAD